MNEWKVKTLQDICEKITDGTHQTPTYFEKGIVFLSSKNVTSGKIDWDNIKYIDEKQHLELHKRVAPKRGDILLAKNGTTGVAAIVDRDVVFDIYVSLAWLRSKGEVTSEYLWHYINSPIAKKQFNSRLKGIGVPNLHLKEIKEVKIPIPPLEEQRTIVAKLDQAFAAIDQAKANIEKNITNAKELFQSKLNQIFSQKGEGWEEKTLGELCLFSQGIQRDVKLQSEICGDNQIRFLRIVDFTQGNEPPRYIDFPGEKYIINSDDIALVRYGASTGFVCHGLVGALANNMFRVIPKSRLISNKFLKIYLESSIFQNVIKIMMNGAAMPAISFGMIDKLKFPFPKSLETQQHIVTQLDQLQEQTNLLVSKYQQKLANLEELKKSILEKAFKGELS